jgi:glycosyltransferase involved in cell wall biosynthesis
MTLFHHLFIRWAWLLVGVWTGGGLAVIGYYTHRSEHHGRHLVSRAAHHIVDLFLVPSRVDVATVGLGFDRGSGVGLNSGAELPRPAPTPSASVRRAGSPIAKPIPRKFVPGLVSVVIPTYNRVSIVGRAIDSVLSQHYRAVEVIVVDDGSTDGTEDLVRKYDSRVRYVRQSNAGVSAARNLGLRETKGEFIALLDSDDEWLPWKIELQVAALHRYSDLGMVWTDMAAVDERGATIADAYLRTMYSGYSRVNTSEIMEVRGRISELNVKNVEGLAARQILAGDIFAYMLLGNLVHTSTVLLRRDRLRAAGGFDESLRVSGEDYDFHLKTCFLGPVGFLDVSSIRYRVGANDQLTAQRFMLQVARNNLTTVVRWIDRGGRKVNVLDKAQIRSTLANAHGWLGIEEYQAGNRKLARQHLAKSLRFGRVDARTASLLVLSVAPAPVAKFVSSLRAARRQARSRSSQNG